MYKCAYNKDMACQWDREKAAANLNKHGIDFADAVSIFSDDLAVTVTDERFEEVHHDRHGCFRSSLSGGVYMARQRDSVDFGSKGDASGTNTV